MLDSLDGTLGKGFCTFRRLILDFLAILPGLVNYQDGTIIEVNNIAQGPAVLKEKQSKPHNDGFDPVKLNGQGCWRNRFSSKAIA